MGRGGVAGPPAMGQSRLKQEAGSVWSHGRNGSWDEAGPGGWDEAAAWSKKNMGTPLWDDMDWNSKHGPKQQQLTKEMVWNSKQFRTLVDMGYKVGTCYWWR